MSNEQQKHTPGPWRAVVRSNQMGVRAVGVDMPPRGAWKPTRDKSLTQEDVANARLIAAAPDMLEALKEFVHPYQSGTLTDRELREKATAAIDKAEGRS